ncbi:MAG: hypothetical protein M9894_02945 [Planctomycetes bacterium]|nr:hypothetical protein [Planctomycetota bacterium]
MSKVVLLYRHQDGRVIEVAGDGSAAEVWQIYPERTLMKKVGGLDAARESIPDGFALDAGAFSPPCPKCNAASPMSLRTGMYVCPDCNASF